MALKDVVVTASLSDNNGTVRGSSNKRQSSFIYGSILSRRSLADIFLTNVDCLGQDNKSFIDGGASHSK